MTHIADATQPQPPPVFGWHLCLDLFDCDPEKLASRRAIQDFVIELCDDYLDMRRYGPTQIEWFGSASIDTEGYSFVQLIETSAIMGHLSPHLRAAYIDIFSCREFVPDDARDCAYKYFAPRTHREMFQTR